MRGISLLGSAVGLLVWMAPPAVDAGAPGLEAALSRCHADLERVVRASGHFKTAPQRSRALLSGLSTACVGVLPSELRTGAAEAASLRGVERSRRLIDAARPFLPEACLAAPGTMAETVESRCPPPEDTQFARPLPRTLDAGSYAYALALRAQLHARGAYGESAGFWVAEFLLRSALEGEARGAR
ncbi:hypothetical protein JQX13_32565 [Archangium violaceum]|uniref:hypothetical protein n=1 Tax=Archangium violaceum TaxID=83451 RepID=UPI00193AE804|nr:hypothetical protein [Archangium violaceum]QRK04929.1 hypothetical protein JQX13_32565 [Archangium violaceum]